MSVSSPRGKPGSPTEQSDGASAIPLLKDGDRLTRDEFERRFDAMPNLRKAELIEGVVHVPSPVRRRSHSAPHFNLIGWLFNDREIDWFVLREGRFEKLSRADDGILRSTIFPGLWLDPDALLRDDLNTLLDVLQRGLDSPEHAVQGPDATGQRRQCKLIRGRLQLLWISDATAVPEVRMAIRRGHSKPRPGCNRGNRDRFVAGPDLGPISDPAAHSIVWRAALGVLNVTERSAFRKCGSPGEPENRHPGGCIFRKESAQYQP